MHFDESVSQVRNVGYRQKPIYGSADTRFEEWVLEILSRDFILFIAGFSLTPIPELNR